MTMKKIALSCLLVAGAVFGAGVAHANCIVHGQVEQVYTNGSGWTYAYVSLSSFTGTPPYLYYFSTNNNNLASALQNSLHKNVYIWGNAGSCPTSGALRNGGVTSNVYVN